MVGHRHVDGLIEEIVFAVGNVAIVDFTSGTGDDLATKCPVPAFTFVAEAEASDVKIGIGNERAEIFIGGRVRAVEVTASDPIIVVERAFDSGIDHESRAPVEGKRDIAEGGA